MLLGEDEWDSVINTSLKGFYNITKPVLREMVRKKRGSIISLSSLSALMPNRGQSNYSAAKAGIIAASRSLATEVARFGIRVNVVAPGLIETDMIKEAPVEQIKQMIPMHAWENLKKWLMSFVFYVLMMLLILQDRLSVLMAGYVDENSLHII